MKPEGGEGLRLSPPLCIQPLDFPRHLVNISPSQACYLVVYYQSA